MTELDEYENNDTEILTIPTVSESEFIEQHNKYQEKKLRNEELQAENKNIYARLLKSNEQITTLVSMVMRSINIDTIKQDLEEHKKLVSSIKENKQNDIIKTKNNKKVIQQFVKTIELF
jgi:hemerythrin